MRNAGTALWQGFDAEWVATPHRLKHLTSRLDDLQADSDGLRGTCRARMTVGQVPDRGVVRTRIGGLRSRTLTFEEGEASGVIEASRGEKARFVGPRVRIDLGDTDPRCATAVLRGFELGCTSHSGGIHAQGISVGLTDLRIDDGALTFVPRAWVRANVSPDFVTSWRKAFAFEFRVLYTAIRGSEAHITHRADPCLRVEHPRGPRPAGRLAHRGRGGFSDAVVGVRGFRWDQRHESFFGRNGRFLRRYQAWLEQQRYDSETGVCEVDPGLWFSNDGMLPWPARSEHRLWTTLIEGVDAVPSITIDQTIATGMEQTHEIAPFQL